MDVRGTETRRARRDDEPANTRVGLRPDDREIGNGPVRDPHFGTVEHPVGAVAPRVRPHARRIASEVRLGQTKAADGLPPRHAGKPALFLPFVAETSDREHPERALNGGEAAHARISGFQFQACEAVRNRARARAPVAVQVHTQQAERAQLAAELARQDAFFEPVRDGRQHAVAYPAAYGIANQALFVGEQTRAVEEVNRVGALAGRAAAFHASA